MFFRMLIAVASSRNNIPLRFSNTIRSSIVYAGLFTIQLNKKNDPNAVLMGCKTGTVGAKVLNILDLANLLLKKNINQQTKFLIFN